MNSNTALTTFTFIFLASLPGRTTFVMLLLATQLPGLPVFLGSVAAFAIQSLFSVFLGTLLSRLPHFWVGLGSGLLFLGFSYKLWHERRASQNDEVGPVLKKSNAWTAARTAFLAVFAAEWGDVSQLAIASVAVHFHEHFMVWASSTLALATTSIVAIVAGKHAHKVVHPKHVHTFSIWIFASVGIYFVFDAFKGS